MWKVSQDFTRLATSNAAFFAPMIDCSMADAEVSMALTETRPPSESRRNEGKDAWIVEGRAIERNEKESSRVKERRIQTPYH